MTINEFDFVFDCHFLYDKRICNHPKLNNARKNRPYFSLEDFIAIMQPDENEYEEIKDYYFNKTLRYVYSN